MGNIASSLTRTASLNRLRPLSAPSTPSSLSSCVAPQSTSHSALCGFLCMHVVNKADPAFPVTRTRLPFMSTMTLASKFLTPCPTYRAPTRSSVVHLSLSWVSVEYLLFVHTALQRDERVLVVWSDNLDGIVPLCRDFESHLIKLVWSHRNSLGGLTPGPSISTTPAGTSAMNSAVDVALNEKPQDTESIPEADPEARVRPISGGSLWGWRIGTRASAPGPRDLEKAGAGARPTRYFAPVYSGLGLALSTCKPLSWQLGYCC
jgi:hypothetical protein